MGQKSRTWIRRISTVILPVFLFLMIPTVGLWFSVLRDGQVSSIVTTVLSDKNVQGDISNELVKNLQDEKNGAKKSEVGKYQGDLVIALSNQLAQSSTQEKLGNVAETVFKAVTSGAKTVDVDPTPLVDDLVSAINSVKGIPSISRNDLGEIKPVVLGKDKALPDLSPVRKGLTLAGLLTFLLSLLCLFLVYKTSNTPYRGIGIHFIVLGTLWSIAVFAGLKVLISKLETGLQADAIPVAASAVLGGIRIIALTLVILGIGAIVAHFKFYKKEVFAK